MKQIKKFLGVFLALAMVVGMVGMMPVVEAKAAVEATITAPDIKNGATCNVLEITFTAAITSYDLKTQVGNVVTKIEIGTEEYTNLVKTENVEWKSSTKVSVPINPAINLVEGSVIKVTFNSLSDAGFNNVGPASATVLNTTSSGGGGTATEGDAGVGLKVADAISFDYDTSVLTIEDVADDDESSSGDSTVVYVAFGKNADLDATAIAKLKYDAYIFNGEISLNLSAISPKKDSFIYLYTDAYKKVVQFTIAKNDTKAKIVFDFSKTKLSEVIKDKNGKVELKDLQVRTPEGNWEFVEDYFGDGQTVAGIDISRLDYYTAYGATLYFRAKGVHTENSDGAEGAALPEQFASAEFKVKVPKEAKAPKVTVDGAKETIKYGKGLEILSDDGEGNPEWKLLSENGATVEMKNLVAAGSATLNEKLFGNKADGIYAIVRTKGTDKKPASKIAVVSLTGEATAENVKATLGLEGTTPSVEIVETPNTNKTTKSILVKNTSDYDIEFYVGASDATGPVGKWTKVKAGKEGKVAKTEAVADRVIFIRLASVKDTVTKINSIPSSQVILGDCPVWVLTAPTAAPDAPALTASVEEGGTSGTKLTVTGTAGAGNKFVYKVSVTEIATPKVGDTVTGTTDITGNVADDITAVADNFIAVYEVDNDGNVVKFKSIKLTETDIKQ